MLCVLTVEQKTLQQSEELINFISRFNVAQLSCLLLFFKISYFFDQYSRRRGWDMANGMPYTFFCLEPSSIGYDVFKYSVGWLISSGMCLNREEREKKKERFTYCLSREIPFWKLYKPFRVAYSV